MRIDKRKLELALATKCKLRKDLLNAGIGNKTINRVLSGFDVRPVTVGKIAAALGVDVTEILADTEHA